MSDKNNLFILCDFYSQEVQAYVNAGKPTHIYWQPQNDVGHTTPLMRYAYDPEILKILIKAPDCQIEAVDDNGNTAFLRLFDNPFAYRKEDFLECLDIFIEAGTNIHVKNNDGHNALYRFLFHKYSEEYDHIFTKLLSLNIDTNIIDNKGNTLLHLAARYALVNPLKQLLETNPNLLNITNARNESAIMILCTGNIEKHFLEQNIKCMKILLSYKPDLSFRLMSQDQSFRLMSQDQTNTNIEKSHYTGNTALMICYRYGHVELFKMLFEADLNVSIREVMTSVICENEKNYPLILEFLREKFQTKNLK